MPEHSPAFAELLAAERDALNARFALRSRGGAQVVAAAFLAHLRDATAPLVNNVHATFPERARGVLLALYDAALDLFAASLLGPEARHSLAGRVWTDLLPHTSRLLARDPQAVVGCLCNAAVYVSQQRGSRPNDWLARMVASVPHCESLAQLLAVGRIAAWQAGLVQFRSAALAAAAELPVSLASRALGLSAEMSPEVLAGVLSCLRNSLWLTAEDALEDDRTSPELTCVASVGSFTGFGGVFARPPVVVFQGGRLVASDGVAQFEVFADAYGEWFRRIAQNSNTANVPLPQGVTVDRSGGLRWGDLQLKQPHLANATGVACDGATLAITIGTSHHVFLFARTGTPA